MQPDIHLNPLAIAAGALATMVLGFLWYGPLFGKIWAKLSGRENMKPDRAQMTRAMVLMLLGAILTSFVLAHSVKVWQPASWHLGEGDKPFYVYGFFAGFFTWLGFYLPVLFSGVAWEGKPWKLFFINAAYYFVNLQVVGMILAYWP